MSATGLNGMRHERNGLGFLPETKKFEMLKNKLETPHCAGRGLDFVNTFSVSKKDKKKERSIKR